MEWIITVFRSFEGVPVPISEVKWSGTLPKDLKRFASKHGGTHLKIQSLQEYLETHEESYDA